MTVAMTVATDKLLYDISQQKQTLSNRLISFDYFLKRCNLSGEIMYKSLSEATVIFDLTDRIVDIESASCKSQLEKNQ